MERKYRRQRINESQSVYHCGISETNIDGIYWYTMSFHEYMTLEHSSISESLKNSFKLKFHPYMCLEESAHWCVIVSSSCREQQNVRIPNLIDGRLVVGLDSKNIFAECDIDDFGSPQYCSNTEIKSLQIPHSVLFITGGTLDVCVSLQHLIIPESLTFVDCGFLRSCMVKSIRLPQTLEIVSPNSFCELASLETLYVEDGVKIIRDGSFMHLPKLKTVYLPRSLKFIGESSFYTFGGTRTLFFVHRDSLAYRYVSAKGFAFYLID